VADFLTWKNIKGYIYPKLINEEINKEILKFVPYNRNTLRDISDKIGYSFIPGERNSESSTIE